MLPNFIRPLDIIATMKEVQTVESLKYGGRTFLYFIGTVLLGGGGIALGAAVGYNAATIRGTGGDPVVYDTPELIAGVVLVSLGSAVLFTGLFGLVYKLLADSVASGVENGEMVARAGTSGSESVETDQTEQQSPAQKDATAETVTSSPGPEPRAPEQSGGSTADSAREDAGTTTEKHAGGASRTDSPTDAQPQSGSERLNYDEGQSSPDGDRRGAAEGRSQTDRGASRDRGAGAGSTARPRSDNQTGDRGAREATGTETEGTAPTDSSGSQPAVDSDTRESAGTTESRGDSESQDAVPSETEATPEPPTDQTDPEPTRGGAATEWGPPGNTDEDQETAAASESAQQAGDQAESLSAEQLRERTAEEIAFGSGESRGDEEASETRQDQSVDDSTPEATSDDEADTESGEDLMAADGETETDDDSTANPLDDETGSETEASTAGTEESESGPDEQQESEQTDQPEDVADLFGTSDTTESDGEDEEDPLVPEYDEIPNEDEEADSEDDDPLGDPFESP